MTQDNAPWTPSSGPDHAKLSALRVPFPASKISKRPKAGIMLDYVGHADVTERMLEVDPEWNWQPCQWEDGMPKFVRSKEGKAVGLWIRLTVCGVTRLGYGSVEPTAADSEKQLIGDAIRNAAMRFGIALELWSKSEAASAAAPAPARAQRVERQIQPPAPKPEEEMASRLAQAFEGEEETQVPFDEATGEVQGGSDVINGVPLNMAYNPEWAYAQTMTFGKHKGMTLRALASSSEGGGYLRWLVNKIAEQYKQGKRPSDIEQAVLIAWDHLSGKG